MKMFHFTIGHLSGINIPVQIYSNELVGELWIDTSESGWIPKARVNTWYST